MFLGAMATGEFTVAFGCLMFLCSQDSLSFIDRCHALTLDTSVSGLLAVHARVCREPKLLSRLNQDGISSRRSSEVFFNRFRRVQDQFSKIVIVSDQIATNPC